MVVLLVRLIDKVVGREKVDEFRFLVSVVDERFEFVVGEEVIWLNGNFVEFEFGVFVNVEV